MTSLHAMIVLFSSLAVAGTVHARASTSTAESPSSTLAVAVDVQGLPMECRRYAWVPADARDDALAWNQLLSLAACLQDASITPIADPDELPAVFDAYTRALEVPMMIYLSAVESAPGPIQLRAAYQIAMLHVTLIVRMRRSIVAPADVTTDPDAIRRDRELHADVEELLAPSARIAWRSFALIDRAVDEDPTFAPDPVTQNMVRSARAMLQIMPRPSEDENGRDRAGSARGAGEPAARARDSAATRRPFGARIALL